ncbi:MAG TPA: NADPH-dependent FMN reductase [Acidimicrobiales bacterium]|nr:NADPH-dependent FMN reductase [Acidimicrobiales bacterium]
MPDRKRSVESGVVPFVPSPHLLLIPGSLRAKSTNAAVLRTVEKMASKEATLTFYQGLGALPHFNPDDDGGTLPVAVQDLRQRIRDADAILFSVPEYAGGLPGSFKNLLDWTIGDAERGSIYEKPVAWINASPRGAVNAHDSLRRVLSYAHAVIIEPACVDVPVSAAAVGNDGLVVDPSSRELIGRAVGHLLASVTNRTRPVT